MMNRRRRIHLWLRDKGLPVTRNPAIRLICAGVALLAATGLALWLVLR